MSMSRRRQPETKCRLMIHASVLDFIEQESAKAPRTETGGVIAGCGDLRSAEVHVTHASKPGPRARRTMFSFSRDTNYCQQFLDKLAVDSGGTIDYLGEWHKHHENVPGPSGRDIATSSEIALDPDYHVELCLLFIIGRSNERDSLRAFVVDGAGVTSRIEWVGCMSCKHENIDSGHGTATQLPSQGSEGL